MRCAGFCAYVEDSSNRTFMMQSPSITKQFLAAAVLMLFVAACSVSTAHISSLKTGKDKAISTEASSFAPTDTIYAQAHAANLPEKVTMQWQVVAEKVTGQPPNTPIAQLNVNNDLPSDGDSTYTLAPPTAGWPTGTYKITVTMMDNGQQRDQKSTEVTVGS
jgi:hypothetical protein